MKTFLELYDSLSPEDKEKLIQSFLKTLNGELLKPILTRKVVKISSLGSEQEIKERIASVIGKPLEQLPNMNFTAELAKAKHNRLAVQKIIAPYEKYLRSNPKNTPDKFEELEDVGRLILANNNSIKLIVPLEEFKSPDFIVEINGLIFGLEHTRLIDKSIKARYSFLKHLILDSQEILSNTGLSGTVNIYIDYGVKALNGKDLTTGKFSKEEKGLLTDILVDYVKNLCTFETSEKPVFVKEVKLTENKEPRLDLILAENYISKSGFNELLKERIQAKEKRYLKYLEEASIKECILLIVVDGYSDYSGFDLKSEKIEYKAESNFKKIILFESFSSTQYILK